MHTHTLKRLFYNPSNFWAGVHVAFIMMNQLYLILALVMLLLTSVAGIFYDLSHLSQQSQNTCGPVQDDEGKVVLLCCLI